MCNFLMKARLTWNNADSIARRASSHEIHRKTQECSRHQRISSSNSSCTAILTMILNAIDITVYLFSFDKWRSRCTGISESLISGVLVAFNTSTLFET